MRGALVGGHTPDPLGDTGSDCGKMRWGTRLSRDIGSSGRVQLRESREVLGAPSRESRVARASPSYGAHLAPPPQSLMDAQNLRIEELLQKIKQQQYKLDKQNLQIKSLQSKVRTCPVLQPPPWSYMLWAPWCPSTPAVPALVALLVPPGFGDPKGAQLWSLGCSVSSVM